MICREGDGTPSSTLAWKIPWMEEPGRLQSMGSLRVGHDWATSLSLFISVLGEGNGNPLQCSCLGNPRVGGAWWAAVYGVAQSRTWLKWLSSSSSRMIWSLFQHRTSAWACVPSPLICQSDRCTLEVASLWDFWWVMDALKRVIVIKCWHLKDSAYCHFNHRDAEFTV